MLLTQVTQPTVAWSPHYLLKVWTWISTVVWPPVFTQPPPNSTLRVIGVGLSRTGTLSTRLALGRWDAGNGCSVIVWHTTPRPTLLGNIGGRLDKDCSYVVRHCPPSNET